MSASRTDRSWRARRAASTDDAGLTGVAAPTAPAAQVTVTAFDDPSGVGHVVLTGGRLEDVLGAVERTYGTAADIVRVDRDIVGGIAGFFGREQFEVEVALPAAPVVAPADVPPTVMPPFDMAPDAEVATPAPTNGASFAAALQEALDQLDEDEGVAAATPAPMPAYVVVEDPPPDVRPAVFEHIVGETAAAPAPAHAHAPAPTPMAASGSGSLLSLRARGMSLDELAAQVDELVIAPPSTPRSGVLAVAGDGDEALVVAEALAVAGGGSAGDVIVMAPVALPGRPSWMCLDSPEQAASRREMWRNSGRLVVVAVVVTPGVRGQEWGRAALDALDPDQTRLAVPGWRRPDEVAGRLAAMAPVHAIDLVGEVDASVVVDYLDLAVPVATIDGVHATSRHWAEMLLAATPSTGTVADDPVLTAALVAAAQQGLTR